MTTTIACQYKVQGWVASVTLHGIATTLAVWFVSQIKPVPLQETFEWTVSLVEAPSEESVAPSAQDTSSAEPAALVSQVQPIPPVTAVSLAVAQEVTTQQSNAVVQLEQPQSLIHLRQEIVIPVLQPAQHATTLHETHEAERLPDAVVQSVASLDTPVRTEADTPILRSDAAVSTPVAEHPESADAHPVAPAGTSTPAQNDERPVETRVESKPVQTAAVPGESVVSQVAVEPTRPVTMDVQQAPTARPDYRWLVESIGKRLAELKRYPPSARLNGWEGQVVLRAVITADGHLAEVKVQKSSGHEALDEAAMESMRQACPLHMRHELGRPEIVVNIPVLYALAR